MSNATQHTVRFARSALLLPLLFGAVFAQGQQDSYGWQVASTVFLADYQGELSRNAFGDQTQGGLSLGVERFLGPGWGLRLQVGAGRIQANDRTTGGFPTADERYPNAARGLNVQTEYGSADLVLVAYTDRPGWLGAGARVSPYAFAGFGVLAFTPRADLLRGERQPYAYWSDGSIRDRQEDAPDANQALIVAQDGDFETDLADLQLEQAGGYATQTWSLPVGVGIKVRLASAWHLALEGEWRWTGTDYLDDVGGQSINPDLATPALEYAADPTGTIGDGVRGDSNGKDRIFAVGLRLGWAFGRRAVDYRGPYWYSGYR